MIMHFVHSVDTTLKRKGRPKKSEGRA